MTPSERAALAEQQRLADTGASPLAPGEAPVKPGSTQPPTPPEPDEGTPWWVWAIGAAVVAFLIGLGVYIAMNRGSDPQPAPPPTTAPTTVNSPSPTPTPEPTTETPPLTEEELAFEAAQQRYRDFLPVFADARVDWDNGSCQP